jgi:hypothetical protein
MELRDCTLHEPVNIIIWEDFEADTRFRIVSAKNKKRFLDVPECFMDTESAKNFALKLCEYARFDVINIIDEGIK